MKIRKGDQVFVIAGKDRGKSGPVSAVFNKENKVVVEGVNVIKKAVKKSKKNAPSGIVDIAAPIAVSNVQIICASCNKGTKIGYKILKDGTKERICKKCGSSIKE
ncbi:MAG: 50S ribosomal protein L24 [Bacteriovoracaceae bacterium]